MHIAEHGAAGEHTGPTTKEKKRSTTEDGGVEKEVALKIIPKKKVKGNEASVWGEMEVLKGLDHPNIVRPFQRFDSRRLMWSRICRSSFTNGSSRATSTTFPSNWRQVENCSKESFAKANSLRRTPLLSFGASRSSAPLVKPADVGPPSSMLKGVAYLHEHDIVHRDMKSVPPATASGRHLPSYAGRRTCYIEQPLTIVMLSSSTLECKTHPSIFVSTCLLMVSVSAKHLHSATEQLTSMAGSFGYVAPEVLLKQGHGKPVDLWAIG